MKIRNNSLSRRTIDIDVSDGVSLHLYAEEYDELIQLVASSISEEVKNAYNVQKNAEKLREECHKFIKDIRNVFYDCDDDSDFAIQRPFNDLSVTEIIQMLKKYSKLLGFI